MLHINTYITPFTAAKHTSHGENIRNYDHFFENFHNYSDTSVLILYYTPQTTSYFFPLNINSHLYILIARCDPLYIIYTKNKQHDATLGHYTKKKKTS